MNVLRRPPMALGPPLARADHGPAQATASQHCANTTSGVHRTR